MDLDSLDDDDAKQLAREIGPHLDPGSYGDRVVLKRRQLMGVATGTLGSGALLSLGVDEAAAQAAGKQGTASSPNNMFAYDLDVANQVVTDLPMGGNAITNAESVSTDSLNKMDFVDASDYNTLQDAFDASVEGDMVLVPPGSYGDATISTAIIVRGLGRALFGAPEVGTITITSSDVQIRSFKGSSIVDNAGTGRTRIIDCFGFDITIDSIACSIRGCDSVDVSSNGQTYAASGNSRSTFDANRVDNF